MSVISDLRDYILGQAGVAILTDSVFVGWAEQEAELPFLVIKPESENSRNAVDDGTTGMVSGIIAVNVHHKTYEEAHELKEAVRNALDMLRGEIGNTFFDDIQLNPVQWLFPNPRAGEQAGECIASMTFNASWAETEPQQ